jgi:4'-phosphopantetheinyl transferase
VIATEIEPGIHLATAEQSELEPHPADRDATTGLPAWRAAESLAARALLRRVLANAAGVTATRIAARESGRPYLPDRPDIHVSLAHDDGMVAAAVSIGGPVGVDIQRRTPVTEALLRRCCTPTALAALAVLTQTAREREFARIWTVQEACVKAAGTGMAGEPWRIPVEVGQLAGAWSGDRLPTYRWLSVPTDPDTPAGVAFAAEHDHPGR